MADEKELVLDDSGKKKKMIIIIAAVAVLLIGGGAFFFLSGDDSTASTPDAAALDAELDSSSSSSDGASESTEAAQGANKGTALYVPLPRPFRFNIQGSSRDRFVEIRVQLLVRGSDNEEAAKMHIPLIESTLLATFSLANADDLSTSAGKTSLKQKSLIEVQKIMKDVEGKKVVEQVLFTGFVMQ